MKKGQTESSFTWIFVSIAGVLILFFFIAFAFDIISFGSKMNALQVRNILNEKMNALGFAVNKFESFSFPSDVDVNLHCDQVSQKMLLSVKELSDAPANLQHIVFSQNNIVGKQFVLWTQNWEYPFLITNYFYLYKPNQKFYLVYDRDSESRVNQINIPGAIIETVSSIPDTVTNSDVIIFFKNPTNLGLLNQNKVLQVTDTQVKFINEGTSKDYLSDEMLVGAFLVSDSEEYQCLYDKSLTKKNLITDIYIRKADYLILKTDNCDNIYNQMKQTLSSYPSLTNKQALDQTKGVLENQNELLRGEGCVELF